VPTGDFLPRHFALLPKGQPAALTKSVPDPITHRCSRPSHSIRRGIRLLPEACAGRSPTMRASSCIQFGIQMPSPRAIAATWRPKAESVNAPLSSGHLETRILIAGALGPASVRSSMPCFAEPGGGSPSPALSHARGHTLWACGNRDRRDCCLSGDARRSSKPRSASAATELGTGMPNCMQLDRQASAAWHGKTSIL
jgi:hypothetical protein